MRFGHYIIKRKIEDLLLLPFIALGRLIALIRPMQREYKVFYFFPFYHTGGAEKIHAQITQACGGKDCIIFFTRKSKGDTFYKDFVDSGCTIRDISRYTDNKWIYFVNFIFRGIISGYLNRQKETPVVFNGHSNFAYKISPWLNSTIRQVDLVHSLNTFSYIRIPFIPFYQQTVLISRTKQEAHLELYRRLQVPGEYLQRFVFINNAAHFPIRKAAEKPTAPLRVLFIGRFSPEKRFPLFRSIAEKVFTQDASIRFEVLGIDEEQGGRSTPNLFYHGEVSDKDAIHERCFQSQVLLLTSSTEGFPLVVIEAMANGCAIAATPVGDIPLHVKSPGQGCIFSTVDDEVRIIEEASAYLLSLNSAKLSQIAHTNIAYAQSHFSLPIFNKAYRSLILPQNNLS